MRNRVSAVGRILCSLYGVPLYFVPSELFELLTQFLCFQLLPFIIFYWQGLINGNKYGSFNPAIVVEVFLDGTSVKFGGCVACQRVHEILFDCDDEAADDENGHRVDGVEFVREILNADLPEAAKLVEVVKEFGSNHPDHLLGSTATANGK